MTTREENIEIVVDDQRIAATLVTSGPVLPCVLFVHGWGGSRAQYLARAREVAALGCVCLTFDLRGHAQTRAQYESVSREDNLRDVVAAYDGLTAQRGIDTSAVAVVGSSYGGYLAAILATLRPVRWLALRAPALYKDSDWALPKWHLREQQDLAAYRLLAVRPEESRALTACRDFTGDVLVVESEQDSVVPRQVITNYREALTGARSLTYRMIEGADHGLSDERWQHTYTALLVAWFTEMLFGPSAVGPQSEAAAPGASPQS